MKMLLTDKLEETTPRPSSRASGNLRRRESLFEKNSAEELSLGKIAKPVEG
jgi:hypothetical protein